MGKRSRTALWVTAARVFLVLPVPLLSMLALRVYPPSSAHEYSSWMEPLFSWVPNLLVSSGFSVVQIGEVLFILWLVVLLTGVVGLLALKLGRNRIAGIVILSGAAVGLISMAEPMGSAVMVVGAVLCLVGGSSMNSNQPA